MNTPTTTPTGKQAVRAQASQLLRRDITEPDDELHDRYALLISAARILTRRGWRIVRTGDCANPDAGIGQCGCSDIRITEEWTDA